MYIGTRFKWIDKTSLDNIQEINEVDYHPLFCSAFASERGPEEWWVTSGSEYFDLYGAPSFEKYGQPSIQTAQCIAAGAKVLCHRVVAADAALANLALYVKVGVGDNGEAVITYYQKSFEGYKNRFIDGLIPLAEAERDRLAGENPDSDVYLLYIFTENGRGLSNKRIRFECNYTLSKTSSYPLYRMIISDGGITSASYNYTLNPTQVADNSNISLGGVLERNTIHIKCYQNDKGIEEFINTIKSITGIDNINNYDIMFGCTSSGTKWNAVSLNTDLSEEGVVIPNNSLGMRLDGGSNGAFGDSPLSTDPVTVTDESGVEHTVTPYEVYTQALVDGFDGTFDNRIFNLDRYKIECIFDANYPDTVKNTISSLAKFREDFFFFRDIGIGCDTLDAIEDACTKASNAVNDDKDYICDKFTGLYCQDYCIRDPYTHKRARVTMLYTMARKMVALLNGSHNTPVAGMRNDMIIDDIIIDTLNFNPVITPTCNQKEKLEDLGINYAYYIDDRLVIETEYTCQKNRTQLFYINNILLVQQVIRRIRSICPQVRYSFITDDDLEIYEADVTEVIDEYRADFNSIKFKYMADEAYENNKIFYATLEVSFKNFVQSEYFEIVAINASATNTEE